MPSTLTTQEILTYRRLNRFVDARWIEWATDMLVQGRDSPTLRIMAGEMPPFDTYEMWAMADRVFEELNMTPFASKLDAAIALTTVRARQMLNHQVSYRNGLCEIRQLYYDSGDPDELWGFYGLYYALEDLEDESQWHGSDEDKSNVHQAIDEQCQTWLEEHPEES